MEVRQNSQSSVEKKLAFQKTVSVENGEHIRRQSLIDDAKFDTYTNVGIHKLDEMHRMALKQSLDEVTSEDADESEPLPATWTCVVSIQSAKIIGEVIKEFEERHVDIIHIESRPLEPTIEGNNNKHLTSCVFRPMQILVQFAGLDVLADSIQRALDKNSKIDAVNVVADDNSALDCVWIPTHITDLDKCNHLITKFEPDLDQGHPGFDDMEYRSRRSEITNIAFAYKQGEKIPDVVYVEGEVAAWRKSYLRLKELFPTHASSIHVENFELLEKAGIYSPYRIPQLNEVSEFLKRHSGFSIRPAAGLLSARDFLSSFAFRVFQSTQYVRHYSRPDHSPEPDCIHELLGHVPMLADPDFAQFSQEIGLISLGASDADIERLATLYWFTVEFGMCKEDGEVRGYGAGLLSSYSELEHALSGKPELKPFDAATAAVQPYKDDDFQPVYFVTESFDDMKERVRAFAQTIKKPIDVRYDPYTQNIQILDSHKTIHGVIEEVKDQLNSLYTVLNKLNKRKLRIKRQSKRKQSGGDIRLNGEPLVMPNGNV